MGGGGGGGGGEAAHNLKRKYRNTFFRPYVFFSWRWGERGGGGAIVACGTMEL